VWSLSTFALKAAKGLVFGVKNTIFSKKQENYPPVPTFIAPAGNRTAEYFFIANAKWFCKKVKIDGNFSGFEKLLAGEI
jgi:hypothetical protein